MKTFLLMASVMIAMPAFAQGSDHDKSAESELSRIVRDSLPLTTVDDYADNGLVQQISQVAGVAQVTVGSEPKVPALADLPAAIKPAEGLNVYRTAHAIGAQIYTCGKNDTGVWTWVFKAPEAVLVDPQVKLLGKHAAGPSWEGLDGGKVVGTVKASAPSPNNSIPWLLLDIKSREGNGEFTQAKAILRVSTEGGVAPTEGCDQAHSGTERRVHYTGVYLFLK